MPQANLPFLCRLKGFLFAQSRWPQRVFTDITGIWKTGVRGSGACLRSVERHVNKTRSRTVITRSKNSLRYTVNVFTWINTSTFSWQQKRSYLQTNGWESSIYSLTNTKKGLLWDETMNQDFLKNIFFKPKERRKLEIGQTAFSLSSKINRFSRTSELLHKQENGDYQHCGRIYASLSHKEFQFRNKCCFDFVASVVKHGL